MILTKSYISGLLKGAGQVMLQDSALTGALFVLAVALGSGSLYVLAGGLVGLMVSTSVGRKVSAREAHEGLWGFNGMLVGCAVFVFLPVSLWAWSMAVVGAALTVPLRRFMDRMLAPAGTGAFTLPFVVVTWGVILVASLAGWTPEQESCVPAGPENMFSILWWLEGCFNGVSQVFLMRSSIAGAMLVLGLLLNRPGDAVWAVVSSVMAMVLALSAGVSPQDAGAGLYGFSSVLTAVAISALPVRRSWRKGVYVIVAVVLTVAVQIAMETIAGAVGLPVLTAPFCIVACLFATFWNKCCH